MENLFTIAFEAHHPERNCHRRYQFSVGRDLFNAWTLVIDFGRVGIGGQQQRFASADPEPLRRILRSRMLRRLSAPKRFDCPYRLVTLTAAECFDSGPWLPSDLVERFSPA